jgi:hypothetical protein
MVHFLQCSFRILLIDLKLSFELKVVQSIFWDFVNKVAKLSMMMFTPSISFYSIDKAHFIPRNDINVCVCNVYYNQGGMIYRGPGFLAVV